MENTSKTKREFFKNTNKIGTLVARQDMIKTKISHTYRKIILGMKMGYTRNQIREYYKNFKITNLQILKIDKFLEKNMNYQNEFKK